jgi:hypothetical protein
MTISAIIIGCITGFISAFFGIGGSSIDTPLLRTILDLPPHLALGTPLPLTLIVVVVASLTFWKKHLIDFRVAVYGLLGGVPGIIFGSYLSGYFPGKLLMLLTAAMLFLVGIDFTYKSFQERNGKEYFREKNPVSAYLIFFLSSLIGVVSGILANGGGILFIPAFVMLFGMKMKEAIATSLLIVSGMALPAIIIHYGLGHIDWSYSAALGIGVIPMAYIGARMDLRTRSSTVKLLFGLFLIVFSVYFFINQL